MSREYDIRDSGSPLRPGTGGAPDPADLGLVHSALDRARASGFALDFRADPVVQQTTTGARVVHLQQQHVGIPVFEASQTVRFSGSGDPLGDVDRSATIPPGTPATPRLPVEQAVLWAAARVAVPGDEERRGTDPFGGPLQPAGVDVTGFRPEVLAVFADHPDRPTVLAPGPFGAPIMASLVWFPATDRLVLGWQVVLTLPGYAEQFRVIVAADSGQILYSRQLVRAVLGRGAVHGLGDPPAARTTTSFPRPLTDYAVPPPAGLPVAFPDPWVALDTTDGNCVRAHSGDADPPVRGVPGGGVVTFDPPEASLDQDVLDAFAHAATMHDVLYLLGFTEAAGNFQTETFGRGGIGNDAVDVRCFPGPIQLTASMSTPVDGFGAVVRLGCVTGTGRPTARDATIVFHEYAHGLTNRLVGGPGNSQALEQPQSEAMGEGWSDFFGCMLGDTTVIGAWAFGRPAGIRRAAYTAAYPFRYGWLQAGPHANGEIWCAALMELARGLGEVPALQLVVDALPLTPANPSFLDGRDALLLALDDRLATGRLDDAGHATAVATMWTAFARYGMGLHAVSPGAGLTGLRADFAVPAVPVPV